MAVANAEHDRRGQFGFELILDSRCDAALVDQRTEFGVQCVLGQRQHFAGQLHRSGRSGSELGLQVGNSLLGLVQVGLQCADFGRGVQAEHNRLSDLGVSSIVGKAEFLFGFGDLFLGEHVTLL